MVFLPYASIIPPARKQKLTKTHIPKLRAGPSVLATLKAVLSKMNTTSASSLPLSDRKGSAILTAGGQAVTAQTPSGSDTPTGQFTVSDLSMTKLNAIHNHLWIAGSYGNLSTLHHQRVILRDIIPSELPQLHLVWFDRKIYVKPLPDCLINQSRYLTQAFDHSGVVAGFLRSYCGLVRYPLDLVIAKESNLISKDVSWEQWATFRDTVLTKTGDLYINKRYEYGELRLNRLDLIYRFTGRGLNYFTVHCTYKTYFAQYFSIFATVFAFVAIILTAMQVLVTIEGIPERVATTSYRFSVAVLIGVCLCFGTILFMFISMFVYNLILTRLAHRRDKASAFQVP